MTDTKVTVRVDHGSAVGPPWPRLAEDVDVPQLATIRTVNRPAAGLARPGVSPTVRWVAIGAATTGVALVVRLLRGR